MDNKKERRKISIAENGDYIVPKERMEELIERIDELTDKAGLSALNSDYCCFVRYDYTNDIRDYHNMSEAGEWIAEIKCEFKFGERGSVKRGHCDNVLCDDHSRLCD